ncbi:MAG TPA: LysE family transporter [Opitutus sp.]|nr:LysE family transporter [Opitutus sp.]
MTIFLEGAVMGFCIAAPVGPIGLLCIRRSMRDGRISGFVSGLGAATADAIFGSIAALGLTAITNFLIAHRSTIELVGGLALLWIGYVIIRSRPRDITAEGAHARSLRSAFASTLLLTLANPTTILTFLGIFAAFGLGVKLTERSHAAWLVAGVFVGSAAWWFILSGSSHWLSRRLTTTGLRIINFVSGALVIAFGLWQLGELVLRQSG